MKRRQLIGYAGAGLVTAVVTNLVDPVPVNAQSSGVSIQWLGHTCFLLTNGNVKILINPFTTLGCTAKYRPPKVASDLVLISSQLLDEGAIDKISGNPKLVYQPGVYEFRGVKFQGITTDHDRIGGKRFGKNVAWKLTSQGINLLHLGGSAAPITLEQKILMGRPDVLFIPVGGSAKAYNPQEAKDAIAVLNPKLVIPTHYRTQAADNNQCDLTSVDDFLTLMQGVNIRRSSNDSVAVNSKSLPENTEIQVLTYKF
ncbi:MAG: MBL fold metallo-hydrolase [Dolichospermum sp. LBC05a]|nr:MBL fold metallo-hydrolase [Dolichospermum sp. OL01]MCO5796245.1 MBL fold metallo-hydrolase [Dolichospermum sp. OL03]MCS6281582.1 MBL fold metallo-hydrolase [Dolichospermum sp.]QSV57868.1 MAG: MBL fold metallo-hydrolase [Dolichospermum sp. LBC05a]